MTLSVLHREKQRWNNITARVQFKSLLRLFALHDHCFSWGWDAFWAKKLNMFQKLSLRVKINVVEYVRVKLDESQMTCVACWKTCLNWPKLVWWSFTGLQSDQARFQLHNQDGRPTKTSKPAYNGLRCFVFCRLLYIFKYFALWFYCRYYSQYELDLILFLNVCFSWS